MSLYAPEVHGYCSFKYDKKPDNTTALHAFLHAVDLTETTPTELDIGTARAVRLPGFLILRATMKTATLVWQRAGLAAQHRYMLYIVHRGALEVSGATGTRHLNGAGVGIIYPGQGAITLRPLMEADITLFSFDAQAVHPHALEPDSALTYPAGSPVLRAASAFLSGILASTGTQSLASMQILRRMTADIAIGLLAEAKGHPIDRSAITIQQILDTNFTNPHFTVQTLCEELRMSRRTLERVCANAGFSPSEALRLRRTEHARQLLMMSDQPPSTAPWLQSGFSSSEQMRRAFLHYYDRTPKQMQVQDRRASHGSPTLDQDLRGRPRLAPTSNDAQDTTAGTLRQ